MNRRLGISLLLGLTLAACDENTGPQGADGTNGANGSDGVSSLIVVADEAAGERCVVGGRRIELGLDTDGDGSLASTEVTATTYVCHGDAGAPGQNGENGAPGENGHDSRIRTSVEPAGAHCIYGGVRIEVGFDVDGDGVLDSDEVDAAQTQYLCQPRAAFEELPSLPTVATVHGFALTASLGDSSPRLGFMFTDPSYRQALIDSGALQQFGGVYNGANVYATYAVTGGVWTAYDGRTTPQTYSFSELVVSGGASYYTTSYPSFGGLVSVIRNGGAGVYALTPAFTTRKAHSIAVPEGGSELYALIAQSGATGLTFSKIAISQFGVTFPNAWVNAAQLEAGAETVAAPQLVVAGTKLAASYLLGSNAVVRATDSAAMVASAADVPVIGGCTDAVLSDIAWTGSQLYLACVDSADVLVVRRASIANLASVTWETISTSITGSFTSIDLEANTSGVSLAVRDGLALQVYANVTDAAPAFEAALPGSFDLARTSSGIMLVVCDFAGDRTVRTFVRP